MKHKLLITTFFSAFLLVATNVKAANFTDNQTVDKNKMWTIEFTGDVGFDDVTKQNITVTDSNNNKVNVDIKIGQDCKTVLVTAPQGGYIEGESYTLNVGSKAHSSKGTPIKNEHKLHFNIKSNTEIVTFKDKNLESGVRETLNKPEGNLLKSDVEKITSLYLNGYGIKDISGIENLTNLGILDLRHNQISDISPLKGLTNLGAVVLIDNQISDISPLEGLTNLEVIDLRNNQVSDISALKGLTGLLYLYLQNNQISDVSPLKRLIKLGSLNLYNNEISDISALKELTNLQLLDLSDNEISDISALKVLTKLVQLNLSGNPISESDKELLKNSLNCKIDCKINWF